MLERISAILWFSGLLFFQQTFSFFVKENLCQIPVDDRVINTELPSLKLGLDGFFKCLGAVHALIHPTNIYWAPSVQQALCSAPDTTVDKTVSAPGAHWFSILAVL